MHELIAKLICLLYGRWDILGTDVVSVSIQVLHGNLVWLAGGIAVALALAALAYSRTTEAVTFKARVLLGLLRAGALVMLLVALMGASVTIQYKESVKPVVGVMLDESRSMTVEEEGAGRAAARDEAWRRLDSLLSGRYDLRMLKAGDGSLSENVKELFVSGNTGSARACVLLTDGREPGSSPAAGADGAGGLAELAGIAPVPVYAVAIGSAKPPRDVAVLRVSPREFVYEKDDALVKATIKVAGAGKANLDVVIEDDGGRSVASTSMKIDEAITTEALLTFRPEGAGLKRYTLRVSEIPDEVTAENNRCEFYLDVRREKIKVLFVEGEPNFEYRHVKQVLESDPAVVPSTLIRLPDGEWFLQGRQTREDGKPTVARLQSGFPANESELFEFDVLILGDLERKFFEVGGGERFEMLRRFLTRRGGGLMTIGGFSVYGAGDFDNTPVAEILPVMVKTEKKRQIRNRFSVRISDAALTHPAMQLEYDPVANAKAWAELPPVEGGSVIYGPKAGATVLAYHPYLKNRFGPRVIMAASRYGRGRVFASALDTTYRWRIGRTTETDYFRRYWGLVVRWLAASPRSRGVKQMLYMDRNVLEAGGTVRLMTNVRDKDFNPVHDADVAFYVTTPGEGETEHHAGASRDMPGLYWHEAKLTRAGEYVFAMEVKKAGGELVKDRLVCRVQQSRSELLNLAADHAGLRGLCEGSGGKMATDPREIAELLDIDSTLRPGKAVIEVWRAVPTMVILVILLGFEWLLRKRRGLA